MPVKQVLDVASLLFAVLIGIPQVVLAARADRPKNLRLLALFLGLCGLLAGASAMVHLLSGPPAVRAAFLGLGVCAGLAWVLSLLSLARHNTTM